MAEGLGFKTFTTGEVLTAADTNGYLMQGVLVFADAAARDAAITSPQEGQVVYLKDTNAVLSYDGSTYVAVGGSSSPLTTKGDLYTFSTVDARLGVGANGTVLTAASGEATGLEWAAPAGGGADWSLLNAGGTSLTGAATITVSGISGKNQLFVIIDEASSASTQSTISIRFNTDSGVSYTQWGSRIESPSSYSADSITNISGNATEIAIGKCANSAVSKVSGYLSIDGCNTAGLKMYTAAGSGNPEASNNQHAIITGGFYSPSSTISSVSIISSDGNFDAGKIYVYTTA
jgi:hypothetical protein